MAEFNAVKIPVCNSSDSHLWVAMCKHSLTLAIPKPITESRTKFIYIAVNWPAEAASTVTDYILKLSETEP